MFNFFDEIKKASKLKPEMLQDYQIITMSGKLLYVEGHKGLIVLTKEEIVFRVKGARISVAGEELLLTELTENTLSISGKINKIEAQT